MGLTIVNVDADCALAVKRAMHDIERALSYAKRRICSENENRRTAQGRIIRIDLAVSSLAPCYAVNPCASCVSIDINGSFVVAIVIKA
jgi:hypothetical protein